MWNVYKDSEVEWGVGLGEMCVSRIYVVEWFSDFSVTSGF